MCKPFRNTTFPFELRLIKLLRSAVAVCTMTFTSSQLALSKFYNGIWTIQTRSWVDPYAVQTRRVRMILIQILPPIGLKELRTLRSILFEDDRQNLCTTRFAIMTLIFEEQNLREHRHSDFYHFYMI